ncbi:DUF3540 domain-containing protein [Variovorax sp. UC74_104]|uniref:DUF3540 domain-containing protein n=1 Tax=Variovorax sp. UC74_104 TaxID=3374555 RepID=UPI0037578CF5
MTMTAGTSISTSVHAPALAESELAPLLQKAAPARPLQQSAVLQGITMAKVVASHSDDSHDVMVSGSPHAIACRRAASCLLVPAPGDTVMVAGPGGDELYLIAIVAQADARQATLAVEGELTLASRSGGIAVRGAGALDMQSDTAIHTRAPEWNLSAARSQCKVSELEYQGAEVRFSVLVSRFVGRACEVVLDRLHLLTRSSFRLTEEIEQVRAGQIDMQSSSTMRLHAKNTLVTSKELVKVDAEQIHMG